MIKCPKCGHEFPILSEAEKRALIQERDRKLARRRLKKSKA